MEINRYTCDMFVGRSGSGYTATMPFMRFTLVSAIRRCGRSRDLYIPLLLLSLYYSLLYSL